MDVPTLPADLPGCHSLITQLLEQLHEAHRDITSRDHQLQQLLRRLYGRSSERIDPNQLALFAEALQQLQEPEQPPPPPPKAPAKPSGNGHGRRRIPADLPRQRIEKDVPENEKSCPCCGRMRQRIGEEISEKLDYEPAKIKVLQTVRPKYACGHCEMEGEGPQIVIAELPVSPIEKGLAAPGLLAHVIVSKYSDHLPLHRLERILKRHGIDIARSTMCDWAAQSATVLRPLYRLMVQDLLGSKVLHTDDTPVNVLEKGRRETRTGRFWVYVGDPEHPCTVFEYTPSRSRDGPMRLLGGWGMEREVYLQADAFGGYDIIYRGRDGARVIEVACWAHARRKFYEARGSDPARSAQALAHIRLLYDVEDQARLLTPAERAALRQELAVPRLEQFKEWLQQQQLAGGGGVLPKSPMGQAITYALNQWDALVVYTTDGDLSIDNNASERALRRIAVGRKNWMFCGSDNGGETAAILFSFIATCERHHVNPFDYLRDVLGRIEAHPKNHLADLLPAHWRPSAPDSSPSSPN